MKSLENFLRLKEELRAERDNATRLETELRKLQDEYPILEASFIAAEDSKKVSELEKMMSENRKRVEELPALIKRSKRRAELLEEKINKAQEDVIKELRETYLEKLRPLIKKLIERWRGVAEVEREIKELKNRADLDLTRVTTAPRILLPFIPTFFTLPDESAVATSEAGAYHPFTRLRKLVEALAQEGFDVSFKESD